MEDGAQWQQTVSLQPAQVADANSPRIPYHTLGKQGQSLQPLPELVHHHQEEVAAQAHLPARDDARSRTATVLWLGGAG